MKTSLDTNVLIHLYSAGEQKILFQRFADGLYMYEQIREVELKHHGRAIIPAVDRDIALGRIKKITDEWLKSKGVLTAFEGRVANNRLLYGPGDMGEVYAISLAETLGIHSLVTDDTKQGGPYMSLLQFEDNDIMPFTYTDVLLLNYLEGIADIATTVSVFEEVNRITGMKWELRSQIAKFVRRFWREPYQECEKIWMKEFCNARGIKAKEKMAVLSRAI